MNYEEARKRYEEERSFVQTKGGPEAIKERKSGKLHVTERVEMLLDSGSWLEYGQFGRAIDPAMKDRTPRDSVMTGLGKIHGHTVAVIADDVNILAASNSLVGLRKTKRVADLARKYSFPIIALCEGGGGRLPDIIGATGFLRTFGMHPDSMNTFANWADRSFMIACTFGPCVGDPTLRANMADITIMREDSSVALVGPPVLESAISEHITHMKLGGPRMHQENTGLVDIIVKTDEECIETVKKILHILRPPEIPVDPVDRLVPSLTTIVPEDKTEVYDMRKVVDVICDSGEWIELKQGFGKGVIVGLGRIAGRLIAIMASQPSSWGGAVDAQGLEKTAGFLEFLKRRRIPILVLQDLPGFAVGSHQERQGLVRKVAHHTKALDELDVPMVTVVLRNAYGVGYYFMGCPASGSDYTVTWSNAEVGFMLPETGALVLTKRVKPEEREEAIARTTKELTLGNSFWEPAYEALIDDIILPEQTRKVICQALDVLAPKEMGPLV